jgi:hypothetical protein
MSNRVRTKRDATAPIGDLQAWARATEAEMADLRRQMLPLEERMAAARERLDLIRRLVGLAERPDSNNAPPRAESRDGAPTPVPPTANLEAHIEAVLAERGAPMHIGDLREALIDKGVPLPGRGDEANIIVRLRRDQSRFTRTGRGTYGLATWGLPAVNPTRTKKVRTRKSAGR